jgi:zinc protease
MILRKLLPALLLTLAPATLRAEPAPAVVTDAATARPWAFASSDIPLDPDFRFGTLPNGMRYIIRHNATPAGTAVVRMDVDSGSLSESETERGFAHFVEHMAFNGSTHVPEGEMVRLLERAGLAFGADTNASTGFEQTLYKLDLPRNDPALLDTALMLMRETASELTFSPEAVARERGVVLAEMRDRNTYGLRDMVDQTEFFYPGSLFARRLPIGTAEALNAATADSLRAFWRREYVPANVTVVVIGDFAPELVEAAINRHFASWQAAPLPSEPNPGPIDFARKGKEGIFIDPALSERITVARIGPWLDEPDTIANRRHNLLRQIGYGIINRRLDRIARQENAPLRDAGLGTGAVFKAARTTRLIIDTADGDWQRGLDAAAREYRRLLDHGVSAAEVAEQLANIHTALRNGAASEATRSSEALSNAALGLLRDETVPATPQSALERFEAFLPHITPDAVMAALREEAIPLDKPLLRFAGRTAPAGGGKAIRKVWKRAMAGKSAALAETAPDQFGYGDFGPPGTVASDSREQQLGIRRIRFANGVRLSLKHTGLERDRVRVEVHVDGGAMLKTADNPLATEMADALPSGGLGKHSQDELETIFAGRSVSIAIKDEPDTFALAARTTKADLALQLQLLAASITDPGWHPEGEVRYRRNIANYFAQKDATPSAALNSAIGGVLSDNDPRFTLQPKEAYQALSFAKLREAIGDRLAHGAIEIALVGDLDEDEAIALVAQTFGAIPPREPEFRPYEAQRIRPFTARRGARVIRHKGAADQAMLRMSWPTRDDSDPVAALTLELLEQVARLELRDSLREALGKTYSPGASSNPSRIWRDYGTFDISASVSVGDVAETRAAMLAAIARLRTAPVPADELQRARQPMLESYDNALKGNGGWMALTDRAQSEADRIDRFLAAKGRLQAIAAEDLRAVAELYLAPEAAVEVLVLPETAP